MVGLSVKTIARRRNCQILPIKFQETFAGIGARPGIEGIVTSWTIRDSNPSGGE
jgi:hypothetical protein